MSVVFGAQSQTLATISFGKSSRQDIVFESIADEPNGRTFFKGERVIGHWCWRMWNGLEGST